MRAKAKIRVETNTLKGESAASLSSMRSHSSPASASGGSCENKENKRRRLSANNTSTRV